MNVASLLSGWLWRMLCQSFYTSPNILPRYTILYYDILKIDNKHTRDRETILRESFLGKISALQRSQVSYIREMER